ncbi:hypothetical protein J2T02_003714 [Chitinophaga terrae (ex Kim and Jung 2007)]|jgi:hypothetical protein|nr:hypothetical protein [Chitinophaga terrae (ex Kim and Jung 2007)]
MIFISFCLYNKMTFKARSRVFTAKFLFFTFAAIYTKWQLNLT